MLSSCLRGWTDTKVARIGKGAGGKSRIRRETFPTLGCSIVCWAARASPELSSKQTFGFFNQNLVMEYNHRQAVADGVHEFSDPSPTWDAIAWLKSITRLPPAATGLVAASLAASCCLLPLTLIGLGRAGAVRGHLHATTSST